ncbi:MAG: hypothetical protein ACKVWV_06150 [Planctomycetota bacterium]
MSRTTVLRRLGTLACAVMFLWTNIATSVHMLAVRHAVCPDHGEIVHVAVDAASGHTHAHDDSAHPNEHSSRAHAAEISTALEEQAHDVCGFATTARPTSPPSKHFVSVARPHAHVALDSLASAPRRASFALILLAPKHSPPRCAEIA